MKRALILFLAILTNICYAQVNNVGDKVTAAKKAELYKKLKVKRVDNYTLTFADGKTEPREERVESQTYNRNGCLLTDTSYSDGAVYSETDYGYDSLGDNINMVTYGADRHVQGIIYYYYDKHHNIIETIDYYNSRQTAHHKYFYDDADNKTEYLNYVLNRNGEERIKSKTLFIYDKNGKNIRTQFYSNYPDTTKSAVDTYKYDVNGNLVSAINYRIDGTINQQISYSYDKKNNLVKETRQGEKGQVMLTYDYKYDNQNRQIEELSNEGGNLYMSTNKYSKDGLVEQTLSLDHTTHKPNGGNKLIYFRF